MKPRTQFLALAGIGAVLIAGFATLYRLRLGRGDFFPPYSSLRSDPLGTRVLYDSLALIPGESVTRWLQPLDQLPSTPARTIVLAGFAQEQWSQVTEEEFAALDAAVRGGSRLVIALQAGRSSGTKEKKASEPAAGPTREEPKKNKNEQPAEAPRDGKKNEDPDEETEETPKLADLGRSWEVTLDRRQLFGSARRGPLAPVALPLEVAWKSDVYFTSTPASPWRTLYRRGYQPVLLERRLGLGSIVLASDAYFLSNEALQRDRFPSLLAWVVGANSQVEFAESHLGVVEDPGVAALARRYGLSGAFFTLLVLTLLFVWRRMALFVPPAEGIGSTVLEYNQTAGLEALLRRAVPRGELVKICATEWRSTARAPDLARVDAVLAAAPKTGSPVAIYNSVVRVLRRR